MKSLSEKTVLLVEDDDADVELTRRAFADLGFDAKLETAGDGRHALELLAAGLRPDLIVTDIKMPRSNGFDLVRALRADPRWKHLPVAFLTSSPEARDRAQAAALGARAYLIKPMGLDEYRPVVAALASLLGGV